MATVDGLTKTRMLQIEAESITAARLDGTGHLILTTHGGTDINVGSVIGPVGPPGPAIGIFPHPLSWKIAGAPVAGGPETPYPPEIPLRVPAGQTLDLVNVIATAWGAWTVRPTFKIQRRTAGAWSDAIGTTAAPLDPGAGIPGTTQVPAGGSISLADGDGLGLVIINAGTPNGPGPWAFTVEVRLDRTV